jgi:hypothetical protein
MNKSNSIIAIFLILLFLNACSTVAEGLGGAKKNKGSDEFLIEKKAPLILPPSFGELPEPGVKTDKNVTANKKDTLDIKEIINRSSSANTNQKNNDLDSSIEKSIIEKINQKKIKEVNIDKAIEETTEQPKKKKFFQKIKEKFNKQ